MDVDDARNTSLADGQIVRKSDPRIVAMGDLDELIAILGVVRAKRASELLLRVQRCLMGICGVLARAQLVDQKTRSEEVFGDLLAEIDRLGNGEFAWVYPGATELEAFANLARAMCRRCERSLVDVDAPDWVLGFVNILSRYLFYLAKT